MTYTTIDTLTDAQISALRAEAGEAGDTKMVHICTVALGESEATDAEVDRCRAECARAITVVEAVRTYALHCGIRAVERWAAEWLTGEYHARRSGYIRYIGVHADPPDPTLTTMVAALHAADAVSAREQAAKWEAVGAHQAATRWTEEAEMLSTCALAEAAAARRH